MKTPQHIAIICDGNRRWAKRLGKTEFSGHKYAVETTIEKDVTLYINATDVPIDGLPSGGAITVRNQWNAGNQVSSDIQMRFANDPAGPWSTWENYTSTKAWTLGCIPSNTCAVYGQLKDVADNESIVFFDSIMFEGKRRLLPLILRNS